MHFRKVSEGYTDQKGWEPLIYSISVIALSITLFSDDFKDALENCLGVINWTTSWLLYAIILLPFISVCSYF